MSMCMLPDDIISEILSRLDYPIKLNFINIIEDLVIKDILAVSISPTSEQLLYLIGILDTMLIACPKISMIINDIFRNIENTKKLDTLFHDAIINCNVNVVKKLCYSVCKYDIDKTIFDFGTTKTSAALYLNGSIPWTIDPIIQNKRLRMFKYLIKSRKVDVNRLYVQPWVSYNMLSYSFSLTTFNKIFLSTKNIRFSIIKILLESSEIDIQKTQETLATNSNRVDDFIYFLNYSHQVDI